MIKADLITGFLGSGKTTFIRKYAEYFLARGEKVGIIENDYGAVNVDMMLLLDLRSDKLEIETVAGACDLDCHMRRFKTKLIAMAMQGFDRVIIEPSGIFDVDEFFDIITDEPLDKWYQTGNVIALVDSRLPDNMSVASDYYLTSQIANAGIILLNKRDLATDDEIRRTREHLLKAQKHTKLFKDLDAVEMEIDSTRLSEEELDKIAVCGYKLCSYVKLMTRDQTAFETMYLLDRPITEAGIRDFCERLFGDNSFGKVLRIKGFFREGDSWRQVNATENELIIKEIPEGQQVIIIIGESLERQMIEAAFPN